MPSQTDFFLSFRKECLLGLFLPVVGDRSNMALVFFVYLYGKNNIIQKACSGSEMRSTVHRPYRQQKVVLIYPAFHV